MKIAISCDAKNPTSNVCRQFGRASYFAIVDLENNNIEYINNTQILNSSSGAGIQSAQHVVNAGVSALISGHCGPKAFRVLQAGDIHIHVNVTGTVQEAIEKYKSGEMVPVKKADVEGH